MVFFQHKLRGWVVKDYPVSFLCLLRIRGVKNITNIYKSKNKHCENIGLDLYMTLKAF